MTGSAARPTAVAAHDLREHVGRGAEGDGVHEAAVDGEVEDDLGRAEVEPGGTGAVTDEERSEALALPLKNVATSSRLSI